MRKRIDDLLRVLGIAQGAQFVWIGLGGGAIIAGLVGGALTSYLTLPGWSIGLSVIGVFVVAAGAMNLLVERLRPKAAESPLAGVIDRGMELRDRLIVESNENSEADWNVRIKDWTQEAEEVVGRIAPHRLRAFRVDFLVADYGADGEQPMWKRNMLVDLDFRLDRLMVLQASL